MFKYSRLKNLLNAILDAQSPQEIYQLAANYIGDDTCVSGNIAHKGLAVNYHFSFNTEHKFLTLGLTVAPIIKGGMPDPTLPPMLNFHLQVKEEQLPILQATITSFFSLLR